MLNATTAATASVTTVRAVFFASSLTTLLLERQSPQHYFRFVAYLVSCLCSLIEVPFLFLLLVLYDQLCFAPLVDMK
jgi:hypothetical protein